MNTVLNIEPLNYSRKAALKWQELGFNYQEQDFEQKSQSYGSNDSVVVLIVRLANYISTPVLDCFPKLRYVISATTGHDHIDEDELSRRGIELISLRGSNEFLNSIPSTAEHTWALLMSLIRKIPFAFDHVKQGGWNRDLFRGFQLFGKTLGIVGLGRTGKKVAQYGKAFGMIVEYYDPLVESESFKRHGSLDSLVSCSDVLSIHVHLNKSTEGLISEKLFNLFKKGALLINTSRGKIVSETAIVNSLESGVLAGYATDVLSNELGKIRQNPIWKAVGLGYNVVITPHIGGATIDAMQSCECFIVEKFRKIEGL